MEHFHPDYYLHLEVADLRLEEKGHQQQSAYRMSTKINFYVGDSQPTQSDPIFLAVESVQFPEKQNQWVSVKKGFGKEQMALHFLNRAAKQLADRFHIESPR